MWLIETVRINGKPSDIITLFEGIPVSEILDLIDINEGRQETIEGVTRLKNFVRLLLDEGILREFKTEEDAALFRKRLNERKKDPELQKKAAKILGYDYELFEKYKLNPFDMFQISGRDNMVLIHYNNNFFSLSALAGKDRSELWKPAVKQARGIIFKFDEIGDKNVSLVSKGYEKFFNLNEIGIKEASLDNILGLAEKYRYAISTKWDGHMGLFYLDRNGEIRITTKGVLGGKSFEESNMNLFMSLVSSGKIDYEKLKEKMAQGYVPIVEIISSHTLVHVPYKISDMILTGVNKIDPKTGEFERELSDNEVTEFAKEIGFTRTLPIVGKGKDDLLAIIQKTAEEKFVTPEDIKEGYVVTFYDDDNDIVGRVKIKYKDYIKLMKMEKVTVKKVISSLANGEGLENFKLYLDGMSDFEELLPDLAKIISSVLNAYNKHRSPVDAPRNKVIENKRKFHEEIQSLHQKEVASLSGLAAMRLKYESPEVNKSYSYAAYSKIASFGIPQILASIPSIIRKHVVLDIA